MKLSIDKNSAEPLYLQLSSQIIDGIENKFYAYNQRLPTEEQLVTLLDISKGTVKSAYAHMEDLGYVKKIRGSGVYVDKIPTEKSHSQLILDDFFRNFDEQNDVTATQGYLVFRDKLNDAFASNTKLYAAVVDSSKEILLSISRQLSIFDDASIVPYVTTDLFSGVRTINPLCKLLIVSKKHYEIMLRYTAPLHMHTEQIVWGESKQTVTSICQIPSEHTIYIIYMSDSFLSLVMDSLHNLQIPNRVIPINSADIPKHFDKESISSFIVADNYVELYPAKSLEFIEKMHKRGNSIIEYSCEIDMGSMQNLEEKIDEIYSASRRHSI